MQIEIVSILSQFIAFKIFCLVSLTKDIEEWFRYGKLKCFFVI